MQVCKPLNKQGLDSYAYALPNTDVPQVQVCPLVPPLYNHDSCPSHVCMPLMSGQNTWKACQ